MLTTSAPPSTASAHSESGRLVDSPNTTVAAPKASTAPKSRGPTRRSMGCRTRTNDMTSAPTAGAERRSPRPQGPVARMSAA